MKRVGAGVGIGTIAILLLTLFLGGDPEEVMQQLEQQQQSTTTQSAPVNVEDDPMADFVSVVLKYNEDVWDKLFREQLQSRYQHPKLVLFSGSDQSACGFASAATGPFYCPADSKVYLDLSFFHDMEKKLGASGDFAYAYVVAHEVGHHIQNLLGITSQVQSQRGRISQEDYNDLSVRLELQADFLAGVWTHHAQKMMDILEKGDIEEAMGAASSVGDDRIQMRTRGYVVPESFTHGTSEQRKRWYYKGLKSGDLNQGDTFGARDL